MIKINKAKLVTKLFDAVHANDNKPRATDLWEPLLDILCKVGVGCVRCHCAWNLRLTYRQQPINSGTVIFDLTCAACAITTYYSVDVVAVARAKPASLYDYISGQLAQRLHKEGWEFWSEREQARGTPTVRLYTDDFHAVTTYCLSAGQRVLETPAGVLYRSTRFAPPAGIKDASLLMSHFDNMADRMCNYCGANKLFWCDWHCTRPVSPLEELFLRRWRPRLEHSSKT